MRTANGRVARIILHSGAWTTNIGNAFIHLGALALLREAAPEAKIGVTSWLPRWLFEKSGMASKSWRQFPRNLGALGSQPVVDNALDITGITDCDLLVVSGAILSEEVIRLGGPALRMAVQAGAKVLFLGVGGQTYSSSERETIRAFLHEISPIGFVSRDDETFAMFSHLAARSLAGIDCAFFAPDAYSPFELRLPPYVVATFDHVPEPAKDLRDRLLVHAHHVSWGPVAPSYCLEPLTLVSDMPYDYLSLYAGAEEVYSDRVHACVAALAYGRRARLYRETPRAALFATVGLADILGTLVSLDRRVVTTAKCEEVAFLARCIRDSCCA